jgi:D-alanyl-lipoteichoic acid acyltransferase DltB (MBOAT superfamily)
MLFNSVEFAVFLPLVFGLYWLLSKSNIKYQNTLLLVSSYIFYGWWDWRFLSLIVFSSCVDFFIGLQLGKSESNSTRKLLLSASLLINLGFLAFFKYYNFFLDSFIEGFTFFGSEFDANRLNIILPVGISFYTFQTLSYTIDIYRKQIEPTTNVISFFTFVSFFPQLVAGPIERASHLLPQFLTKRNFNYDFAVSGVQLIVWGLFKKMVIADNSAIIVQGIFASYESQSPISLIIGMLLFAFQIYCDFSGYSDIAIGTGRLFGFDLMTNFKFPYLSKSISEFWKRWHISLSTWFRDYLYIPLGGSKVSEGKALRNIFIVFIVSGFWHGANWTFIVWGFIHALLYIPMFLKSKSKAVVSKDPTNFKNILNGLFIFTFVCFAWVYFRSDTVTDATSYIFNIFNPKGSSAFFSSTSKYQIITLISFISIIFLMLVEYYNYRKNNFEVRITPKWLILLCIVICFLGAFKDHSSFIYFQF